MDKEQGKVPNSTENKQGEVTNQSAEMNTEDTVNANMADIPNTPVTSGTKRPLSLSPMTEEDMAENKKQGKDIMVSPPMLQDPKRRGLSSDKTENQRIGEGTGNDPTQGQGEGPMNCKTNVADQNNNSNVPNLNQTEKSEKDGGEAAELDSLLSTRTVRKASLRGKKQRRQTGNVDPDTIVSEGTTSDTQNVGDVGSARQTGNRAVRQIQGNTQNISEMALQKIQRGRGRPRSRTASVDRAPKAQDIYSLLLEIKDKQEAGQTDIGLLSSKMGEMQQNLDVNLDKLNVKTKEIDIRVTKIQCNQVLNEEKIEDIESRTAKLEDEIVRHKRGYDEVNDKCAERVSQVEYELAADIETVKNNIEEQMAYERQIQMQLENKFANFTRELEVENSKMKENMKELKQDLESLKVQNADLASTRSEGSGSNSGASSHSMFSHASDNHETDDLYMFGDSSFSLIFDGIREMRHENLYELVHHCVTDMGIPMNISDIESVTRLGIREEVVKRPRPIKVILKDQTIRDQIFYFKSRLRYTSIFKAVMIHREERKDIRVRLAKLKQVGLTAKKMGHRVEFHLDLCQIRIDGVVYTTIGLNQIPKKFTYELRHVKPPPVNHRRLSLFQKCRRKSDNVIMVGPSLQKTPFGLGFFSIHCFLSNFHHCDINFEGQSYTCLEQGYQCIKAKVCKDEKALTEIMKCKRPADMKRLGADIVTNERWECIKLEVMEELVFCKFRQNKVLYNCLLNTRPHNLIECTLDEFWGAGCLLGSIALNEGCWPGQNYLGKILVRVRSQLAIELEESKK